MSNKATPLKDILDLTQELVRTPSRSLEDDPQSIMDVITNWADQNSLTFHKLQDESGKSLGGYFHYSSGKPGLSICFNACIDTCQFGDPETWDDAPTSAKIEGDYMYGRGVADSKIAVSLFCHIFKNITENDLKSGDFYVLLDADEHTGNFGGIKHFLKDHKKIDAAFIGYPGNKEIMIGARGFLRAEIKVPGIAAHSGSSSPAKDNALVKTAQLIDMISSTPLPAENNPEFPFGPKVTVTAIDGGQGYSQIPDKITVNLDMRLTPDFDKNAADMWLRDIIKNFENANDQNKGINISYAESWPSYALDKDHVAVKALHENAERELNHLVTLRICGPSNIGNYLADKNIPALCGFGVEAQNIHAPNENIRISSIEAAYNSYYKTAKTLCP